MESEPLNLPARIADALVSIPKGLTPGVVKALDRLLVATVDIPVAWLAQKKAKIDAQTESFKLVEAAIAQAVASGAGADFETTQRAMNALVRKEYRKQGNREAVAAVMMQEMQDHVTSTTDESVPLPEDDWLNIFERYAEDASSERLQGLWGRVLAGEIRRPGRFSPRTLRFLSEFSQADALTFETFAKCAFGDSAPKKLVVPDDKNDIRDLIYLESSGLVKGVTGLGLQRTITLKEKGLAFLPEGDLLVVLKGEPGSKIVHQVISLTPLGQELLCLVPSRSPREAAKAVAFALRDASIHEAYLGVRASIDGKLHMMEMLWVTEDPNARTVDGTTAKG